MNPIPGRRAATALAVATSLAAAGPGGALAHDIGGGFYRAPPPSLPPSVTVPNIPFPDLPPGGVESDTVGLRPLTPREQAEVDAANARFDQAIANIKAKGMDAATAGAEFADAAGGYAKTILGFIPGVGQNVKIPLDAGRGFSGAYSKALEKGASQAEAIEAGMKGAATAAGLSWGFGKLTGGTTASTQKKVGDAFNNLGKNPGNVPKLVTNAGAWMATKLGTKGAKDALNGAAKDSFANTAAQNTQNQGSAPPAGGSSGNADKANKAYGEGRPAFGSRPGIQY